MSGMNSETLHDVMAISQPVFTSESQQLTSVTQQAASQLLCVGINGNTWTPPNNRSDKRAVYFHIFFTGS